MAVRIALGNNKGGVGKSAATINLAAGLAEEGRSVLVVPLDPQMNAERRLGIHVDEDNPVPTISEAIKDGRSGVAIDAITEVEWPEPYRSLIRVIPARYDLENRVSEAAVPGAVLRLRTALEGVDDDIDFTLFDLPPSLGHLTQLGLCATRYTLIVSEPEYDSVGSAVRMRDFIEANATVLYNADIENLGFIINRYRPQLGAHNYQLEGLDERFGEGKTWMPYVEERTAIKDAADSEVPLRTLGTAVATSLANNWRDHARHLIKVTS
jgi:chromosome partitioning protein